MSWTLDEFIYEMTVMDPDRRVVFVEGLRDLSFWKVIIPVKQRGDTSFYEAADLEVPPHDNCRQRLIEAARVTSSTTVSDRVMYFVDADWDRLCGHPAPQNVVFTDCRDLECYLLSEGRIQLLCDVILAQRVSKARMCEQSIEDACLYMSAARLFSHRGGHNLSISAAVDARYKRILKRAAGVVTLDTERFLKAILEYTDGGLQRLSWLREGVEAESVALRAIEADQYVHGKDLTKVLAIALGLEPDIVSPYVFSAIYADADQVRVAPAISEVSEWAKR